MATDHPTRGRRGLPGLGQFVSDGVGDLQGLLRLIPEITRYLKVISANTGNMDREVTGMHAAVRDLREEVVQLREEIQELDRRMGTVGEAVARLEPHIEDVNLAVRPLRRARAALGGRAIHGPEGP